MSVLSEADVRRIVREEIAAHEAARAAEIASDLRVLGESFSESRYEAGVVEREASQGAKRDSLGRSFRQETIHLSDSGSVVIEQIAGVFQKVAEQGLNGTLPEPTEGELE